MPTISDIPPALKAFESLGLELDYRRSGTQALGVCPFCGKAKFYASKESGLWDCKPCGISGNPVAFLRKLYEASAAAGILTDLTPLADNRRLSVDVLERWGVATSLLTGEYLVPGYNLAGEIHQLYRYEIGGYLGVTPGVHGQGESHGLFGVPLLEKSKNGRWGKKDLLVCEGPWDGMAIDEALRRAGMSEQYEVIAVPGCNVWREEWGEICRKRKVYLLYDNDHPRTNDKTGTVSPPAGFAGMRRVSASLLKSKPGPSEVRYLAWGGEGNDHNPGLPDGYDVRDYLTQEYPEIPDGPTIARLLSTLLQETYVVPVVWALEPSGGDTLACLPCTSWNLLANAWRAALKWTEGLDRGLSVMLSCVVSVRMPGDQLWVKIISPPSGGKTTLCEALAVNSRWTISKSVLRGFHSGWGAKGEASLIRKVRDKTFLLKDGDTLLSQPNLAQILAEARDLYDTVSRSHYRNGNGSDETGVRMTWIICGTESLRQLDSSELGERCLDCVVIDEIDEDMEDEIGLKAIRRIVSSKGVEANGDPASHFSPELVKAMRLTGGYVGYLRENAADLLNGVEMDDATMKTLLDLGKFVAFMRARPSKKQDESVTREMSTRLRIQLSRLAICLAAVLGRPEVDGEVMRRVRRVARDTSRGRSLNVVCKLYDLGYEGIDKRSLIQLVNETPAKLGELLLFLYRLKIVETFYPVLHGRNRSAILRYRLTDRVRALYTTVMVETPEPSTDESDVEVEDHA